MQSYTYMHIITVSPMYQPAHEYYYYYIILYYIIILLLYIIYYYYFIQDEAKKHRTCTMMKYNKIKLKKKKLNCH